MRACVTGRRSSSRAALTANWATDRCSHVRAVQRRLRALGWYAGEPDGIYGVATSEAVLRFRESAQLGREDVVDGPVYAALGLMLFE